MRRITSRRRWLNKEEVEENRKRKEEGCGGKIAFQVYIPFSSRLEREAKFPDRPLVTCTLLGKKYIGP